MTLLSPQRAARRAYSNDSVLSATPVQLLTMLYDRLLLDLARAEAAQGQERWSDASAQLLHAQAIVDELQTSLKADQWEGAESLNSLYTFVSTRLVEANVTRDATHTRECIDLLEPLRQAWHAAAQSLPAQDHASTHTEGSLGIG